MVFCFSLCTLLSFPASGAAASPPEGLAPEEITGLSIHYSHMSTESESSFDLRDDKGEILFSCNFFTVDGQEITLKDVPVDPEYMRRLRETAKEHHFAQIQEQRPPSEIFILDEPMSGLDPLGRQLVVDLIRDYHARGNTILFCSHVLSDVERICTRIGIMHQGRLATITTPEELRALPLEPGQSKTPLETLFLRTVREAQP